MFVTTSYKIKITDYSNIFNKTIAIYRDALIYIIDVVNKKWETVKALDNTKAQVMHVEHLIHNTKSNMAFCDFDRRFYKFPSYLRRAAINDAIGKVSSYKSNYQNWLANPKGKAPRLGLNYYEYPVLFRDNMFIRIDDYTAKIKIIHQNDWVWLTVKLRKSDADYILRHKSNAKESSPTLFKQGRKWFLRFAFTEKTVLTSEAKIITAVDLGINNAATCCAMLPDGTIIGRKIISFPIEKDQMIHKLNKLKKAQQHGAKKTPRLWAFVNNFNRSLSEKTANTIIEFSLLYNSDVIVLEHLDFKGKKKGSKKQLLHLWRKKAVFAMVACKAHLLGIRLSTICAWGTSKLAFDGSGITERGKYIQNEIEKYNYSVCTFTSGKQYNCDLNASYNIGARYYIRELLKSLPEMVRLTVEAKVPHLVKRTTCVLSDLINFNAELKQVTV